MKTLSELEAMPDDELRVVLAELGGYKKHPVEKCWYIDGFHGFNSKTQHIEILPNYPRDLNACHELEINMPAAWKYHYIVNLRNITGDLRSEGITFADARQRTICLILIIQ